MQYVDIIQVLKPKTSRRSLLVIAGLAWMIAGIMLVSRGIGIAGNSSLNFLLSLFSGFIAGGLFYIIIFSRLSFRQIKRIINLENNKPCLFSFFSVKSYFMMILMISTGVLLRKSGIIIPEYLSLMYIAMGIPLLISSFRFCYHAIIYGKFDRVG